jgi:hypothetical protein
MTLRRAHGNGAAALLRVETAPVDELPEGVPGDTGVTSPVAAGTGAQWTAGDPRTVEAARAGGRARAGKTRLASQLGLSSLDADPAYRPYRAAAELRGGRNAPPWPRQSAEATAAPGRARSSPPLPWRSPRPDTSMTPLRATPTSWPVPRGSPTRTARRS